MHKLCDALRDTSKPVVESLRAAGLREVNFEDLTEEDIVKPEADRKDENDKFWPHIAAMGTTLARVNHGAHPIAGESFCDEYIPGQLLMGLKS